MVTRRDFLKLGAAAASAATFGISPTRRATAAEKWTRGGVDYSHLRGTKRTAVPTACEQCASRCPAIGYVERGRVVKIEGHPDSLRTLGRLCGRGQAGVNQIYDPDRILHPLRRVGARGEGKWKRITWDEALDELSGRLKKLLDAGEPEKFFFQHGWISASADRLINGAFLPTFGTATVATHTCLGQGAKFIGHELTWGGLYDNWDLDNANFVINFGSNFLEAHTNHVGLARRLAYAMTDRNLEMVTFDVRLSNTAAKSRQWIPLKPGTDLAVVLAMCHVIMHEDLYKGEGEEFLEYCKVTADPNASIADKVAALKAHLEPYTPEWAEEISGVAAEKIHAIAIEMTTRTKKPACVISSRGAAAHYNGVDTERAIQMLAAITGNIDNPGGRCRGIAPKWGYETGPKKKPKPRTLDILAGFEGQAALPAHGISHQIFRRIQDGGAGRPEVYVWYATNPVYANGNVQENIDILKDETLLPFTVAVNPYYDESAALADMILPDATYLERYDFEETASPTQVPEYYIRQPVVPPLGEARDFKDVVCQLAKKLKLKKWKIKDGKRFVSKAVSRTKILKKKVRGFRGMTKVGLWHDAKAEPAFYSYREAVDAKALKKRGVILDDATGVYWNWKTAGLKSESEALEAGYTATPGAFKGYVGQRIGETVSAGFEPSRFNTSGLFELYSSILEERGLPPLPTFLGVPEHREMKDGELILTTFKINVHTLSRTQNCRWLSEIQHDNPAWINAATAAAHGIVDGDTIKVRSAIGEIETIARVTQVIVPGVIAIPPHCGRWEGGRYASGKKAPEGYDNPPFDELKWWTAVGAHPNWIIPNAGEPVSGQQRWMDTVVTVAKA
jgi:thiosulfate reductase / polysulfide reductase chain A